MSEPQETSLGIRQYRKVVNAAKKLGIEAPRGISRSELQYMVANRITELLAAKGIEPGVTILYDNEAGTHAGERAVVSDIDVSWNQGDPQVTLIKEGAHKPHTFQALPVVLYASVIE